MKGGERKEILRFVENHQWGIPEEIEIPEEIQIDILLKDIKLVTLSASPDEIYELCCGFLFTEGLIDNIQDISRIEYNPITREIKVDTAGKDSLSRLVQMRHIGISSGCGKGFTFTNPYNLSDFKKLNTNAMIDRVKIKQRVIDIMAYQSKSGLSRGLHIASIFDNDKIYHISYDVARHNAVDKILGFCLLNNISTRGKFLYTTGRISSEMILKCARSEIPVVVSHSSPTSLSIKIAQTLNITVLGYVRKSSFILYSNPERIMKTT